MLTKTNLQKQQRNRNSLQKILMECMSKQHLVFTIEKVVSYKAILNFSKVLFPNINV